MGPFIPHKLPGPQLRAILDILLLVLALWRRHDRLADFWIILHHRQRGSPDLLRISGNCETHDDIHLNVTQLHRVPVYGHTGPKPCSSRVEAWHAAGQYHKSGYDVFTDGTVVPRLLPFSIPPNTICPTAER